VGDFNLLAAIVGLAVFIVSVTLHEAAHAWAAMLGGDLTAYNGGQVTLDPTPHIKREPVGMVVIPLISTFVFLSGANDWNNDLGFHLLGGVELGALNVELQLQRAFESGSDTSYAVYAGFVW